MPDAVPVSNLSDSGMRRRWEEFKWAQSDGDPRCFFLGTVGGKRPDILKVNLSTKKTLRRCHTAESLPNLGRY